MLPRKLLLIPSLILAANPKLAKTLIKEIGITSDDFEDSSENADQGLTSLDLNDPHCSLIADTAAARATPVFDAESHRSCALRDVPTEIPRAIDE